MARTEGHWLERGTYLEPDSPLGYDILIKGLNKYINFNSIVGEAGYGIRDNNGVIEIKNSTGDWTSGLQDLQSVTDLGATTTNVITNKAAPTFTYTTGKLTGIAYSDGTNKALTYNGDGTLNTLTITKAGTPTTVKTLVWSSGVLQSINIV